MADARREASIGIGELGKQLGSIADFLLEQRRRKAEEEESKARIDIAERDVGLREQQEKRLSAVQATNVELAKRGQNLEEKKFRYEQRMDVEQRVNDVLQKYGQTRAAESLPAEAQTYLTYVKAGYTPEVAFKILHGEKPEKPPTLEDAWNFFLDQLKVRGFMGLNVFDTETAATNAANFYNAYGRAINPNYFLGKEEGPTPPELDTGKESDTKLRKITTVPTTQMPVEHEKLLMQQLLPAIEVTYGDSLSEEDLSDLELVLPTMLKQYGQEDISDDEADRLTIKILKVLRQPSAGSAEQ